MDRMTHRVHQDLLTQVAASEEEARAVRRILGPDLQRDICLNRRRTNMTFIRDLLDALRIGLEAALRHMADMRHLRAGGCPDDAPF